MHRRSFLGLAASAALASATPSLLAAPESTLAPMELGLLIAPSGPPDSSIQRVHDLGFSNCFISLDSYLGHLTPELASDMQTSLGRHSVTVTTVEVVGPKPLEWNFKRGPATIGLVPPATRAARLDALRQASDFAHRLGITQVQTHCGFIPEDPADPLYPPTVAAIREITRHCAGNGQHFLMETGQETPTTMSRTLHDVNEPNLAVGLDTANVILYGKARPTDVVDIPLDVSRLDTPLDIRVRNEKPEVEDIVLKKALNAIEEARSPCIVGDVLGKRHNAQSLTQKLAELSLIHSLF